MIARLGLYFTVFAGGAVLMALEMLASRMLAPYFGNSVYVWGSIISVFLAALSVGYYLGGRVADRRPTLGGLARMVILAGATVAVLLVAGPRLAGAVGELTAGFTWGALAASAILFVPPSVVLATLSPYAVRLAAHDITHLGATAGRLYAVSTLGSLVGTLGCTFGLIPYLQLADILAILLAATAATALVAALAAPSRDRLAAGFAVALLLAAGLLRPSAPLATGVVYERMTPYQTLRVVDEAGVRYLESDRVRHGAIELTGGELALTYVRSLPAALLLQPEIRRVLVIGMGGGNVADYFHDQIPGVEFDFVDVDPAVPEVARRFMGFRDGPGVRVHVGDGRRYLERSEEQWDLIFIDAYIGLSVPFHLTTREFLVEMRPRLAPGGVLAINLAAGPERPFPRAIMRTTAAVFPRIYRFRVPGGGNSIVLATDGAEEVSAAEMRRRATLLDGRYAFDPSLAELAGQRAHEAVDFTGVPVLGDQFAPVDRLINLRDDTPEAPRRER